jgi:UDP-N-acetylmuramoylalanine--D-glutamate ligase
MAEVVGRRIYNDSKSTSPGATIAALQAIDGPTWLLAGGNSKGATFDELSATIVERACGAAVFGTARDVLQSSILVRDTEFSVCSVETMDEALEWCWLQSRAGDAIVLSPACASHDQFLDYHHRGETFRALVRELSARAVS